MKENLINSGDAHEQAEAALCIWEHVIETRCSMGGHLKEADAYEWFCQDQGVCAGRDAVLNFAPFADAVYQEANKNYDLDGEVFDWEVIPIIVQVCVENFTNPNWLVEGDVGYAAGLLLGRIADHVE